MNDPTFEARFVREHVDMFARVHWNKVGFRDGWTRATALATLEICYWLWSNGYKFATETKMKNGLRADILCIELDGSQVIEVMDSETPEMLEKKRLIYARDGIEMLGVPADSEKAIAIIKAANNLK